ncbi:MAG: hypothetical protein BGO55_01180 [Sphingobacteriales bacterium 50-39]|nr:hypothetical protein [Sphingobacteriales bacterium]OJW53724.1 MAG: hypothetical protein BGO55_01180 [Sphingobacteriales bacterium 50-39]
MRCIFILFLIITGGFIHAQDLTGVWQGHFRDNNMNMRNSFFDDRYKFEVQIAEHDKNLEAITYSYLSTLFYGKAAATGAVNPKTGKVIVQEVKLLEVRNQGGDVAIMTCFLQYSRSGGEEFLEGTYSSMNLRDSSRGSRGSVFLRKVPQSDFYKEPFLVKKEKEMDMAKHRNPPESTEVVKIKPKDDSARHTTEPSRTPATAGRTTNRPSNGSAMVKPSTKPTGAPRPVVKPRPKEPETAPLVKVSIPQTTRPAAPDSSANIGKHFSVITPKVLQSRSTVLAKAITVNTREVVLNIYDDGAIDHDTVSVYLDKKLIVSHAMLTDRPIVVTLHLDESDEYHELVMVAENEGEIPPNTSLMIVKAGDKEYDVRITTTEQKNAMVTFRYQK